MPVGDVRLSYGRRLSATPGPFRSPRRRANPVPTGSCTGAGGTPAPFPAPQWPEWRRFAGAAEWAAAPLPTSRATDRGAVFAV